MSIRVEKCCTSVDARGEVSIREGKCRYERRSVDVGGECGR